jgi:hypothetical protein
LGGFLRRLKGRLGGQAAVTATAHKLARIVYLALKHGLAYVRRSQEVYEAQMREKQIQALRRKARQLGLDVVAQASGGVPTAAAATWPGAPPESITRCWTGLLGWAGGGLKDRRLTAGSLNGWLRFWRGRGVRNERLFARTFTALEIDAVKRSLGQVKDLAGSAAANCRR